MYFSHTLAGQQAKANYCFCPPAASVFICLSSINTRNRQKSHLSPHKAGFKAKQEKEGASACTASAGLQQHSPPSQHRVHAELMESQGYTLSYWRNNNALTISSLPNISSKLKMHWWTSISWNTYVFVVNIIKGNWLFHPSFLCTNT